MKFFRAVLSNFTVSLSLVLIVLVILNYYNPMMGFLRSAPAMVVILLSAVCSIATALASYIDWRRDTAEKEEIDRIL